MTTRTHRIVVIAGTIAAAILIALVVTAGVARADDGELPPGAPYTDGPSAAPCWHDPTLDADDDGCAPELGDGFVCPDGFDATGDPWAPCNDSAAGPDPFHPDDSCLFGVACLPQEDLGWVELGPATTLEADGEEAGEELEDLEPARRSQIAQERPDGLPVTGTPAGALALLGAAMVAGGALLVRRARRLSSAT